MPIDRRHALKLLLAGAAGLALDPERLLWTPRTMITVPALPATLIQWGPLSAEYVRIMSVVEWAKRYEVPLHIHPWQEEVVKEREGLRWTT